MVSLFLVQSILWLMVPSSSQESPPIALPHCEDHCGKVKIPYPFGIDANCSYDASYLIICNKSFHPPKPFLPKFNLEVMDINWPGRYPPRGPRRRLLESPNTHKLIINTSAVSLCSGDVAKDTSGLQLKYDFTGSPYVLSRLYNVFMVENCGGSVVLKNRSGGFLGGCASYCANASTTNISTCYGIGCCQTTLLPPPTDSYLSVYWTQGLDYYEIAVHRRTSNTCSLIASFVDIGYAKMTAWRLPPFSASFPTALEWNATDISNTLSHDNRVTCYSQCQCNDDIYEGNPYLPNGCQVVPECRKCKHHCDFDGTNYYCKKNQTLKLAFTYGFSIGMGLVLLALGSYWMYRFIKRRREMKRKARCFKRNGGLLLQQQMSSNDGVVEKTKIFSVTELENATENFSESRILGQGGQGTVYKGMLMDGRIVAIKKSTKVDESQLDQFINEVVILSQINHRNVVKLLGCCLETEVPLLVYEFIPNGTLYQLLHDPNEDFHVTWKMRLQIAAESAGAVAYLHSSMSAPIYHRDIKSSNVLLDDKYRAKVSDFGTSRAITVEQTHLTTCVLGTYGYLDPEYFRSNQFTEKSDVYSFGVVLTELITGMKPVELNQSGGWISLATEFLSKMENSALLDMLDSRISEEGKEEEFIAVANLAKQCLNMNGKQRPTMKEIAMLLDEIRNPPVPSSEKQKFVESECEIMEISDMPGPFISSSDSGSIWDSLH